MRWRRRRSEAGISVIEATVSGFVVAISVAGLAISVVYGRQLEKATAQTWRATSAATATMEQIRSDSMSSWSGIETGWSGQICSESGFGDPIGDKMTATVGSDETKLDSSAGMWSSGASAPNFYFVKIAPSSSEGELSNALQFQTYVANRRAQSGASAAGGGSGTGAAGGSGGGSATSAESLSTTPASLAYTNKNKTAGFSLTNSSSKALAITGISATGFSNVKLTTLTINGIQVYKNTKGTATITVSNAATLLASGLAAGAVNVSVIGTAALNAGTVSLSFTFADNSTATIAVKP